MYKHLFGTNVRKSYAYSFVTQYLLNERAKIKAGRKDMNVEDFYHWYSPYFGVSDFRLREQCKELVQDPRYKAQTGNVIYPIDFNTVDRVRKYKSPAQLISDRPSFVWKHGRMIPVWDYEVLLGTTHPQDTDSIREFLCWVGHSDHDVAFETMYHKFTYGEVKVPKAVLNQMERDNPGCFGGGHEPIPEVSQWAVAEKKGSRQWRGMTRHSGGLY